MAQDVTILTSAARKIAAVPGPTVDLGDDAVLRVEMTLAAIEATSDARGVRTNPHVPQLEVTLEQAPAASGPWRPLHVFQPFDVTEKTGDEGAKGWPAGSYRRTLVADRYVRAQVVPRYLVTNLDDADKVAVTVGITARAVGADT